MSAIFVFLQYLLPHHGLSRVVAWITNAGFLRLFLINWFIKRYNVDMAEAKLEQPADYASFNAFFTRALKPAARPITPGADAIIQPADGTLSQFGVIDGDTLLQAKGVSYELSALLAGDQALAGPFRDGCFATTYLAPGDYHRVHMPLAGTLQQTLYVPGRLFSVNPVTAARVPGLFTRNERLVCRFDTEAGPMIVILVGAMIVAGIETAWSGQVCPGPGAGAPNISAGRPRSTDYSSANHSSTNRAAASRPPWLDTGAELGRFQFGSTVIVLFTADAVTLEPTLQLESKVQMGQRLARIQVRPDGAG